MLKISRYSKEINTKHTHNITLILPSKLNIDKIMHELMNKGKDCYEIQFHCDFTVVPSEVVTHMKVFRGFIDHNPPFITYRCLLEESSNYSGDVIKKNCFFLHIQLVMCSYREGAAIYVHWKSPSKCIFSSLLYTSNCIIKAPSIKSQSPFFLFVYYYLQTKINKCDK